MKRTIKMWRTLLVTFALVLLVAPAAMAEYPEKQITMISVFPPGGSVDTTARALCVEAEKILGQPIVFITKDGGAGTVGLALLAVEKPDGYTLGAGTSTGIMRVPLVRKMTYKPLVDFTNIFGYATPPSGLMVRPDSPHKSFKDLVEYARANPGKVSYSTAGAGSPMHLVMEVIAKKEKIKWTHIPFKGTAPAEMACIGGHVEAVSAGDLNQAINGQLRLLLIHTKERYHKFPDVPTTLELGYNYYNNTIFSFFGPAGLNPAVVKKLEDAFYKAQETKSWKEMEEARGVMTVRMKSAEYTKFLEEAWHKEVETQKMLGLIEKPATEPR